MWSNDTVKISEVESMLDLYDVEVESPDGWIGVKEFVHKPDSEEYVLTAGGNKVSSSPGHRYETERGWVEVKDMEPGEDVLTDTGWVPCDIVKTGRTIPIVDISVDHPNHRYFTNGISSHNTGKSALMCNLAASYLRQHKSVLYITMEMAEERIAERIDANILKVPVNDIEKLTKDEYLSKFKRRMDNVKGKLVIKEYPTMGASAATFKSLLKELQIKKKFKPDVILIDYLGICSSSRFNGSSENSYHFLKSVAEEVRGLAIEQDLVVWSAAQVNRGSFNDTNPDMTAVADSFGLPAVSDFMVAMTTSDELTEMGTVQLSIIKNRYSDHKKSFVVNADYPRMTFSDVSDDVKMSAPVKADLSQKPRFGKKREKKFEGIVVN